MINDYTQANRKLWNAWMKIHETSKFYDNESFKAGHNTLRQIELDELGEVSGKSLLHLAAGLNIEFLHEFPRRCSSNYLSWKKGIIGGVC